MKRKHLVFALLFLFFAACSKKSEDSASSKSSVLGKILSESIVEELADTIVGVIPQNSFGFFHWDMNHPAYQRMQQSPWQGGEEVYIDALKDNKDVGHIFEMLKAAGIDFFDPERRKEIFSEAVVFASPSAAGDKKLNIGIAYNHASGVDLDKEMENLKTQFANAAYKVADISVAKGKGFSVSSDVPENSTFIGWKSGRGVIASTADLVGKVLSADKNELALLKTSEFKRATENFPANKIRYAFGYFDLNRLLKTADVNIPNSNGSTLSTADMPLKAVGLAVGMDKAPFGEMRVVYDAQTDEEKKWAAIFESSQGGKLVSAIPESPLFFLSLDGGTIARVGELAASQNSNGAVVAPQLEMLSKLKRIGIAAHTAPLGQSLLPIPEIVLVAETEDAANLKTQLLAVLHGVMASSAGGNWKEKKIDGVTTNYMISPLGVGAFIASKDNLVIAASSELKIRSMISGISAGLGEFGSKLKSKEKKALIENQTVANVYIDMVEVGTFLENMGGMLSMYAAQSEEAKKWLDPEKIQQYKKMGSMVGLVVSDRKKGVIGFSSFYEQST